MNYADTFANRAETVYRQLPPSATLHLARSSFAALLLEAHKEARISEKSHSEFGDEIKEVIETLTIPTFTEIDSESDLPGKRQPTLLESLDATVERYAAIDRLEGVFSGSADAMIYGGSMKYGPFLNVRSGTDASDIDAIVFTGKNTLGDIDWRGIMETDLFDETDLITFFARMGLQRNLYENGLIDITSQRFSIAHGGYTMSTHFVPVDFIDEAYPTDTDKPAETTYHKYIRDYKERAFERTHVTNYGMTRNEHTIPVYNTPAQGGFIASNPAYSIIGSRYVPGMYQNLVLPDAKFIFGSNSKAGEHLAKFASFASEREEEEKLTHPDASIRNTEPRLPILPQDVSDILNT